MTDTNSKSPAKRVGYRNPPAEHRFRKGVSGNPKGRPRKRTHGERALVSTKVDGAPGIGFEDRVKSLAIEEAYRMIPIREGDRVEQISVIQAILRRIAVNAANGDAKAQKLFLDSIGSAEAARREATMELLRAAVEYKERWGAILAERARTGEAGPEPVPHPDDVIIDTRTGDIRIEGPVLEEQKRAQDQLHDMWSDLERRLVEVNEQLGAHPDNAALRKEQMTLTEITDWLRADTAKRALRQGLPRRAKRADKTG